MKAAAATAAFPWKVEQAPGKGRRNVWGELDSDEFKQKRLWADLSAAQAYRLGITYLDK